MLNKRRLKKLQKKAAARKVFLEEEPKVAAIGAGMDIFQPSGNMVVDIGGGTTDIAVLSMGDIVTSSSIKMAGDKFDNEILHYIKRKYKLLIGERTAENIKIQVATVFPGSRKEVIDIRGRDMVSGLPRTISVNSKKLKKLFASRFLSLYKLPKVYLSGHRLNFLPILSTEASF